MARFTAIMINVENSDYNNVVVGEANSITYIRRKAVSALKWNREWQDEEYSSVDIRKGNTHVGTVEYREGQGRNKGMWVYRAKTKSGNYLCYRLYPFGNIDKTPLKG